MKSYKKIFLLFLFNFCIVGNLLSQSLSFKTYTADDGLPQNTIFAIHQDSRGFLWFATEGGVARFDGTHFKVFGLKEGLPNPNVRSIYESKDGRIWFGTSNGVAIFQNDSIHALNSPKLESEIIFSFYETADNRMLFGTYRGGILECNGDSVYSAVDSSKIPSRTIYSIKADTSGRVWIGTSGEGVYCLKGDEIINYNRQNGLLSDSVYCIHQDYKGDIWLGTGQGAVVFKNNHFRRIGNINAVVRSITEDINQNIWLAYYGNGVGFYDGDRIQLYTTSEGLPDDFLQSSLTDSRGDIWFGTRNGLAQLAAEHFEIYTVANGLSADVVYSISEDSKGDYLFGHDGYGISVFKRSGVYDYITVKDGLIDSSISSIFLDHKKNLWFGSLKGVSKYDGKKFTNYTTDDGLAGEVVLSIAEDKDANLWFGGQGGATRFDGDSLEVFTTDDGLPPDWIMDIFLDRDGNLWFATDEGGVSKFNGRQFKNFSVEDGLPVNSIYCITQDVFGDFWFGTDGGGICKFDGSDFTVYNSSNGLASDVCYSIVEVNNFLYVGTTKGITRIEYDQINEKGKEAFKVYSKEVGIPSSEMTQGGSLKDSKGNIWFGTQRGAIKINPALQPKLVSPPLYVTNIRILEGMNEIDTLVTSGLELSHNQNNLRFDFNGISFASPEKLMYKYKLDGILDTNWVDTKESSVSYPYLPPGDYSFNVKAVNNDGLWSDDVKITFIINPPFYSTWWFTSILFLLAATSIYGFYIYKTGQVKKRNLELANMVRERTSQLEKEKNKSDELLMNILPSSLVTELKESGKVQPREFKNISILFTDFKGFTYTSSVLPADKLVNELNDIFREFDRIVETFSCEKLKTIGDSYMAGAGLPEENDFHAVQVILAAIEMQKFMVSRNENSAIKWEMRAGIHSGNVIAGVVGTKKFTYDIWGDTVNVASRMESSGEPGMINISAYTYMLVRDYFDCEYRGKIDAKGKGKVDMYFVKNIKPEKTVILHEKIGVIT